MSLPIKVVDGVYPNGTPNKAVFVGEMQIGTLSCVDGGFKEMGWRSVVESLDAAIAKMRKEAIIDRQKQIIQLQREIELLKD